jgi:hypothetical protein
MGWASGLAGMRTSGGARSGLAAAASRISQPQVPAPPAPASASQPRGRAASGAVRAERSPVTRPLQTGAYQRPGGGPSGDPKEEHATRNRIMADLFANAMQGFQR